MLGGCYPLRRCACRLVLKLSHYHRASRLHLLTGYLRSWSHRKVITPAYLATLADVYAKWILGVQKTPARSKTERPSPRQASAGQKEAADIIVIFIHQEDSMGLEARDK